ncbi:Glycosylphosphatidylinositol anchor attachment 1 protein [Trebouxia sp. C0010 RCD-2024]
MDWLDAYHGHPSSAQTVFGRSGLLQQAVVLEMDADRFNALQVRTLGWNGQLPMLDLYYLIKRLSENGPGLQLSQKMDTPFMDRMPAKLRKYWPDMWKVMTFSWQQATTMPTGLHAEFIQHGVDAVTLETYMQPIQGAWSYGVEEGVTKLAVLLELTVRSLNNLLERFHHSTMFYLLLSPDWHVPFQVHIVPPLLLAIVLVLQAADTPQLTSLQGQHVGNSLAWSAALKECLYLQVMCNACKCCFILLGKGTSILPLCLQATVASWQPHTIQALVMYATAAAGAVWLITHLCIRSSVKCTVQHRLYTRTVAQGIAAAQASALICTNWATAFYTLILLVPLLSQSPSSSKWQNRAHTWLTFMLVMLIFLACSVIVSSAPYSSLMEQTSRQAGWTRSTDSVDNATLTFMMGHTNSLSAPLSILLPACMVMLHW